MREQRKIVDKKKKRICLQSYAALALINPLFFNFSRHSIIPHYKYPLLTCFPSY